MLPLLQHSLFYGLILSACMSIFIVVTLRFAPEIWLDSAPADIRASGAALAPHGRRRRLQLAVPVYGFVVGLLGYAALRVVRLEGSDDLFWPLALSTFLIIQTFNLVDLVIIDWLIVVKLRPSFAVLPGTAGLPGYDDYGFHFRGFLKGLVGGALFSLVFAAIGVVLVAIFG